MGKGTYTPRRTCPVYIVAFMPISEIQDVISHVNPYEDSVVGQSEISGRSSRCADPRIYTVGNVHAQENKRQN